MNECEKKPEDFSSIHIVRVVRRALSDRLSFPSDDEKILVVSPVEGYETVPDVINNLFRSKPRMERLENPDWIWCLRGGLKTGFYVRQENQKEKVIKGLEDYLSSVEKLVGKEVPVARLYPGFPKNEDFNGFNIPNTSYYLRFRTAQGFLGVQLVGNDFMIHHDVGSIFYKN